MTILKRPLDARRLRSVLPRGFGWIDHRFLTAGYLRGLSPHARGLYCLLVCAADRQGLSYYSDQRLRELLAMDPPALLGARRELLDAGLIAYQKPLCQVLALDGQGDPARPCPATPRPVSTPPPPPVPRRARPESPPPAWPTGLSLRAMVEASLREGSIG